MRKLFDIDSSELVRFTNRLERMHKSDLPLVVRGTLNDAAFEGRGESMQIFKNTTDFDRTKGRFINSHNVVNKSPNTFDVKGMHSEFGIIKGKSKSGDNLEEKERGGSMKNRGVPTESVRVSGSENRKIRKKEYFNKYKGASKGVVERNSKYTIIKTEKSVLRVSSGGRWKTLYRMRGSVMIEKSPFIEPAGNIAASRIPRIFQRNAEKRINK